MKVFVSMSLALSLLTLQACADSSQLEESKRSALESADAVQEAKVGLYVDDMGASALHLDDAAKDDSVKDDMKANRLAAMAEKMLDRLDSDDSGSISLVEFQAMAERKCKGDKEEASAEEIAKRQAALKTEFEKIAGTDGQLSIDEIKTSLASASDRVAKFRKKKFPEGQEGRSKEAKEEILAKYDTNKNGKIDPEEREALRKDEKASRKKGPGKDGDKETGDKESGGGKDDSSGGKPDTTPAPKPDPVPTPKPDPTPTPAPAGDAAAGKTAFEGKCAACHDTAELKGVTVSQLASASKKGKHSSFTAMFSGTTAQNLAAYLKNP